MQVEVLDDLLDHWDSRQHAAERDTYIRLMQVGGLGRLCEPPCVGPGGGRRGGGGACVSRVPVDSKISADTAPEHTRTCIHPRPLTPAPPHTHQHPPAPPSTPARPPQGLSAERGFRVSFLSGDVHCAGYGMFHDSGGRHGGDEAVEHMRLPKGEALARDPKFMPQVGVSRVSAVTHTNHSRVATGSRSNPLPRSISLPVPCCRHALPSLPSAPLHPPLPPRGVDTSYL